MKDLRHMTIYIYIYIYVKCVIEAIDNYSKLWVTWHDSNIAHNTSWSWFGILSITHVDHKGQTKKMSSKVGLVLMSLPSIKLELNVTSTKYDVPNQFYVIDLCSGQIDKNQQIESQFKILKKKCFNLNTMMLIC